MEYTERLNFKQYRRIIFCTLIVSIVTLLTTSRLTAISTEQKRVIDSGARNFDLEIAANNCSPGGSTTLRGENNAQKVFNYFIDKGLTPEQAAGPTGNAMIETAGGSFDVDPTAHAPPGTAGPVAYHGIFQWDAADRWPRLESFAAATSRSSDDMALQLDFSWFELTGEPDTPAADQAAKASHRRAYDALVAATTVDASADAWTRIYEVGAGAAARREAAQRAYEAFKSGGGGAGGDNSSSPSGGCSGSAYVNTEGYAFPLELPVGSGGQPDKTKLQAFTSLPCTAGPNGCHHDQSPAFDLIHTPASDTLGKKVYAIHDGVVNYVRDNYDGQSGCFSIGFEQTGSQNSEDDGWKYWYGHITNPVVSDGQQVQAGDILAEVGPLRCAKNTIEHLHIDRGAPKGTAGGRDSARDPGFIDLINSLYEDLP